MKIFTTKSSKDISKDKCVYLIFYNLGAVDKDSMDLADISKGLPDHASTFVIPVKGQPREGQNIRIEVIK